VTTGVVVCPDGGVVDADDDHRPAEVLVLHKVPRVWDLLEAAGHLPHPGPEQFPFHLEELGVVVAP
jgi:hypothetical protein